MQGRPENEKEGHQPGRWEMVDNVVIRRCGEKEGEQSSACPRTAPAYSADGQLRAFRFR